MLHYSGNPKYEESLRVERTQQDLINETAIELANLPRFQAYAKIIDEEGGWQQVVKRKIHTFPLPPVVWQLTRPKDPEKSAREYGHRYCKKRVEIDAEIRERQERWLAISRPQSPTSAQPPPTSEPPPTRG